MHDEYEPPHLLAHMLMEDQKAFTRRKQRADRQEDLKQARRRPDEGEPA